MNEIEIERVLALKILDYLKTPQKAVLVFGALMTGRRLIL